MGAVAPSASNWRPSTPHHIFRRGCVKKGAADEQIFGGGLSGSNYKTMQAWFVAADTLAEQLTELFNRIAAGQVPASIVPLLTAGRGVPSPNQEAKGCAQWLWEAFFSVLLKPLP